MATRRNPTAVWIISRKGKRGQSYRLRWIDARSGQWQSEACGRDLAYARVRRDQLRQELRDGLAGKLPDMTIGELAERLATLMAGPNDDIQVEVPLVEDLPPASHPSYLGAQLNPFGLGVPAGAAAVLTSAGRPVGCDTSATASASFELQ